MRTVIAVLTALLAGSSAWGDIALNSTEGGARLLTGGRGELSSYGLSEYLVDANTSLYTLATAPMAIPGPVDAFLGVENMAGAPPVGHLIYGPNKTLLTFDRLAVVHVLQLLGFDHDEDDVEDQPLPQSGARAVQRPVGGFSGGESSGPVFVLPQVMEPEGIDQGFDSELDGIDQGFDDEPTIPEPGTLALLLLAVPLSGRSVMRRQR